MKATLLIRAAMAWVLTFCIVMHGGLAAAEPDNDAQHANAVKVGEKITFSIAPLHDRDYFTLTAPGSGTLRFKLTKPLKQHTGVYVWWGEQDGGEVRGGIWDRRVAKGEICVLAVRSNIYDWNDVTNAEVIEGVFEFVAEMAASEPNDTAAQAQKVAVGEKISLTLSPLHDRDYFSVVSPGGGTMRFKLTQPLKQHQGLYVWWGEEKGNEVRGGIWDRRVTAGETCVLGVRSNIYEWNDVTNDEVIEGVFEFVAEMAASEPNDTAAQAQKVAVGEKISFTIAPLHDRDYFTLTAPGNGMLRFKLTKPLKQHETLYVWWGEQGGNEMRGGIWNRRVTAGETCVLGVRSNIYEWNDVTNDEVVEGMFEFVAELAASEPNDTAAQAQKVTVGEKIGFTIAPLHDRDYFSVMSPGRGTLRFKLMQPLKQHDGLYVWWGEQGGNEVRGGIWERRVELGETCVLGVRSNIYEWNDITNDEVITGAFEFIIDSLPGEPNDTPQQANAIKLDTPFEAVLLPLHDRDYFKVVSPGDGVIKLYRLDHASIHPGLFPWWVRKDGKFIEGSWDHRVTKGETAVFGLRSSRYDWNESAAEQAVKLQAVWIEEPLDTEHGDTPAEANDAEISKPFRFALLPSYDRDFVRVQCPQRGVLKVVFPRSPTERIDVWWQRAGSEEIIRDATLKVEAGETVYVGIAPEGWSSDQIFEGAIRYADGAEAAGPQTRRWTFKMDRSSAPKSSPP